MRKAKNSFDCGNVGGRFRRALLAIAVCGCGLAGPRVSVAQDTALMPDTVLFVTSTGYWEESGDPLDGLDTKNTDAAAKNPAARPSRTPDAADQSQSDKTTKKDETSKRRGYYKLVAVRQPEGNAHIFLQQVALDADGPKLVSSAELEEFSVIKAYVTDIRPERSDGVSLQPGLFATVYLKLDPAAADPETWTVLIDDIGDIKVERETN